MARASLQRLWAVFLFQSAAFVVILAAAVLYLGIGGLAPQWGNYTLVAGVLSLLPSVTLRRRYREFLQRGPRGGETDDGWLRRRQQRLVLGLAVTDLPALAGFAHYLLAGDVAVLLFFGAATPVLVYLYRPAPR